jgi:hypothetical protein
MVPNANDSEISPVELDAVAVGWTLGRESRPRYLDREVSGFHDPANVEFLGGDGRGDQPLDGLTIPDYRLAHFGEDLG